MSRLVLLNGPPGAGKSTIASLFVLHHPLALNLDVDLIRRLIGGWQERGERSGELARGIALAAASAHLRAGYDVVVPQYLGRAEFIEKLRAVAVEESASFHEVVLMTNRDDTIRRFDERTSSSADPTHVEAAVMAQLEDDDDPVGVMHDRLVGLLEGRPDAVVVWVIEGDSTSTYLGLVRAVGL